MYLFFMNMAAIGRVVDNVDENSTESSAAIAGFWYGTTVGNTLRVSPDFFCFQLVRHCGRSFAHDSPRSDRRISFCCDMMGYSCGVEERGTDW